MYPTHTLLAQVAADRTADAERQCRGPPSAPHPLASHLDRHGPAPATRSPLGRDRREARPASA
jgi:hypothetical protein